MRRGGTWIQRWRVPLGFLCAAAFIILARPRPLTLADRGRDLRPGTGHPGMGSGTYPKK